MAVSATRRRAAQTPEVVQETVSEENLLEYTEKCITIYGRRTIENRAVPDFQDGLIPVQRRILWAMIKMNLGRGRVKSARVVGEVLGKYHPHGDTAVYESMVTMVQAPLSLIQGSGNWGNFDDPKSFAAQRYTECGLTRLCQKIYFATPYQLKAAQLISNFDGSEREPVILHSNIPVCLALGKLGGIAVGVTCNIPSFTVESVVKLTTMALQGKKITPELCMKTLQFDFAWGGQIHPKHIRDGTLLEFFKTGIGTIQFQSNYVIDEKARTVTITGLAPQAGFLTCMTATSEAGYKVDDLSGEDGMRVVVTLGGRGRTANKEDYDRVIQIWTGRSIPLRCNFTHRQFTEAAVAEGDDALDIKFLSMGVHEYVTRWAAYRLDLQKKIAELEMQDLRHEKSRLDLLILARANFDLVKESLDQESPVDWLSEQLEIEREDANYILQQRIISLSKVDITQTRKHISSIKSRLSELKTIKADPVQSVIGQLEEVLK